MALDVHLEDPMQEILEFILDTTIERWKDEGPSQREAMAADPSYTTMDDLLDATGILSDMLQKAIALRELILLPDIAA